MPFPFRPAAALALALLLSACGGGGDDPVDTTDYRTRDAWSGFVTPSALRGWTATGRGSDGADYELFIGLAPQSATVFPVTGTTANRVELTARVRRNGTLLGESRTELFTDANKRLIGTRDALTASDCGVARAGSQPPPETARLGDEGLLFVADERDGCSAGSTKTGENRADWSLERDGGVSYFCIHTTLADANGAPVGRESDCVETTPAGTLGTRARISLEIAGGFSVVARTP